ncbi:sugar kinase [Flavobacterium sp. W21_SRS_FM6]|uniref:sugar kinase n=1 Tax=Flavobacterium sp. W21_SRS_FM6 TaxID=3240268 RepID=UPI003F9391F3
MQKIVLFGECMLELRQGGEGNIMHRSFAGDVFNTAVYLKRAFFEHQVSFMSGVGHDVISQELAANCQAEGLQTSLLRRSASHNPGIYLVQTDEHGERSFLYWRENSAARQMMKLLDDDIRNTVCKADLFFFSGISLAILAPEDRATFWQFLSELQEAGVTIAFDPNYRARLWQSEDDARHQFSLAFAASAIVLPGIEDFATLYGHQTLEDVVAFCAPFNIKELIIKNGPSSVFCKTEYCHFSLPVEPVKKVVDTTSAGDSFNGVYLGARQAGYDIKLAVELAAKAAGLVIQFPGAIVPNENFSELIRAQLLAFEHQAS